MDLEQDFKDTLACWASGVTVVAVRDASGLVYGLTASSFTSVSLRPPLILVCLTNESRLTPMIATAGSFAVSLLAFGQQPVSEAFARRGRAPDADPGPYLIPGPNGHPIVRDAAAFLACDVEAMHVQGDHTIVVGRVDATCAASQPQPLVYFRRAYGTVTAE